MRAKLLTVRVGLVVGLIAVISSLLLLSTATTIKAFPFSYPHVLNNETATPPVPKNSAITSVPETSKTDDELFAVQTRLQAVLPEEYVDYEVWSLHLVEDWAYFALVRCEEVPSRIGECGITHFRIAIAKFLPDTDEWNIYVEGTDEYLLALKRVPSQLQWLAALWESGIGPASIDDLNVAYSIPGLPWPVGTSWRYNYGPADPTHPNEFDFGVPTAGVQDQVYAAEVGTVVAKDGTCVWIQRSSDGLRLFYQHIESSDISNLAIGRPINRGDWLGRTTVSPGCKGSTTNHHLHFSFYSPYSGGVLNPQGFSMNGWLVQGNTLVKGDQVRTANRSDRVLHSGEQPPPRCDAPSSGAPRDNVTLNNRRVTFTWTPPTCTGLDYYTFRVANHPNIDNGPWLIDHGVSKDATSVTEDIPSQYEGQTLYWAIWPHNSSGYGSRGGAWTFRVDTSAPPTPPPLPSGSWSVEYFRNKELSDRCATATHDGAFVFKDWGEAAPAGGCNSDNWSARFSRRVHLQAGCYAFAVEADDWGRFYVNSDLVVNKWNGASQHYESRCYGSDGDYDLKVEFADTLGAAKILRVVAGSGL